MIEQVIEIIFQTHSYQEPVIRVQNIGPAAPRVSMTARIQTAGGTQRVTGRKNRKTNLHETSGISTGADTYNSTAVAWSTAGLFTRLHSIGQLDDARLAWSLWRVWYSCRHSCIGTAECCGKLPENELAQLARCGLGGACHGFDITSLRHTSVAHVAVIYATAPFLPPCSAG